MNTPTKNYYKFQADDADKMSVIGNSLNLSEPGVGKSAILIRLIAGRTLIIVPKSVLFQMSDEIVAFRPELRATVISGTPGQRKKQFDTAGDIVLLTYETLRIGITQIAALPAFQTILIDEIHRLGSTTTKTHKAIRNLLAYYRKQSYPAPRIHGFTASLIMNSSLDCFGVFNIIKPNLFPNYLYFVNEYCYRHPTFGYILGDRASKLPKLGEMIKPYYISRTLAEVAPQLPPHLDQVISFELSPKESKLYSDIRSELLLQILPKDIDLVKNPISLQNALVKMCKLQELTDSPDLLGHSEIPSTKFSILQEKLAEILIGNDRKCVVFSRFSRTINMLETLLKDYNPVKIIGDVTGEDRQANILKFKTDKTCRILLCTTAGSEGISLEEASYLIRLNVPFSIGRDIQLTGRIRRITSEEPTFSYTLCAKNSVDEKMLKILAKKKLINQTVFTLSDIEELLQS
jgi:SNF2 family DNA or RNA helicase